MNIDYASEIKDKLKETLIALQQDITALQQNLAAGRWDPDVVSQWRGGPAAKKTGEIASLLEEQESLLPLRQEPPPEGQRFPERTRDE